MTPLLHPALLVQADEASGMSWQWEKATWNSGRGDGDTAWCLERARRYRVAAEVLSDLAHGREPLP